MSSVKDNSNLEKFETELGPDEQILWTGRPVSPLAHAKSAKMTGIYGSVVLLFSIFWTISVLSSAQFQADSNSALWVGLFIMLVGLIQTGMPIFAYVNARHMQYALTNQRLIIFHQFAGEELQEVPISRFETPILSEHPDGTRDVIIWRQKPNLFSLNRAKKNVGLIGLCANEAEEVCGLLETLPANCDERS